MLESGRPLLIKTTYEFLRSHTHYIDKPYTSTSHTHMYMHAQTLHTHTLTNAHTHTQHMHTHTHTYAHTCTHTHAHVQWHTHVLMHALTHTHTSVLGLPILTRIRSTMSISWCLSITASSILLALLWNREFTYTITLSINYGSSQCLWLVQKYSSSKNLVT